MSSPPPPHYKNNGIIWFWPPSYCYLCTSLARLHTLKRMPKLLSFPPTAFKCFGVSCLQMYIFYTLTSIMDPSISPYPINNY